MAVIRAECGSTGVTTRPDPYVISSLYPIQPVSWLSVNSWNKCFNTFCGSHLTLNFKLSPLPLHHPFRKNIANLRGVLNWVLNLHFFPVIYLDFQCLTKPDVSFTF